jgi:hypothetical protein
MSIIISVVLSGCSSNKKHDEAGGSEGLSNTTNSQSKYQVLVYDYSDSVPSVKHEVEYEFADHEKYDDEKIKNRVELSIGENTYRGDFQSRQYNGYNYYPTNMYLDSENNNFEIDDSGMLTFVFRGESSSGGAELSRDAYLQIAKDFLGGIIDISPYDISIEYKSDSQIYVIKFEKYINGIKTTDTATVSLNTNGELYSYSSFMLGKVTTEAVASSIDMDSARESVNKKLDQLCDDAKKVYSRVEYKEPSFWLTVLKDGTTGLICTADVNCICSEGEYDLTISERIGLVVIID